MKNFVLLYITYKDGTSKKSIYEADSEEAAIALYHNEMGKAMNDKNVATVLCEARNTLGGTYSTSHYERVNADEV